MSYYVFFKMSIKKNELVYSKNKNIIFIFKKMIDIYIDIHGL